MKEKEIYEAPKVQELDLDESFSFGIPIPSGIGE